MSKERNVKDIFWIVLVWVIALAFVYLVIVKLKMFFK